MNIEELAQQREQLLHEQQQRADSAPSELIDGAALLTELCAFLARFVAYPSVYAQLAHALWIVHTHLMDVWDSTPRIAFLSPEPGSGKTRGLEISELLVPRPVEAINATPAYLFRKVSDTDGLPTILFDEVDTLFGARAKEHEEIRGILNAGHRRGAMAGRCVVVGKTVKTEELPAYCAVALAGLGNLPDTILTRSVIIGMRKRAPGEHIEPFRRRLYLTAGHALRDRIADWAKQIAPRLTGNYPPMPGSIVDRDADVWEPLIAIADAAGGDWPSRTRKAAEELIKAARDNTPSLGVRLLTDLRTVFPDSSAAMTTDAILAALIALHESPWSDLRGKPLDAVRLAKYLRPYGVKPKVVRIGESTPRGYEREDLRDAWSRYLAAPPAPSATPATPATGRAVAGFLPATEKSSPATPATTDPSKTAEVACVAGVAGLQPPEEPAAPVPEVPEVPDLRGPDSACVRCSGCVWFSQKKCENDTCNNYDTSVDPDTPRACPGFRQAVP